MSTFIAVVVYGAFAVGYLSMLLLTERCAGRYVAGEIAPARAHTSVVIVAPQRVRTATTAATVPAFSRVTATTR